MKIILLINSLNTGGAEFSTLSLYSWLAKKEGTSITVVCLKKALQEYDHIKFGIKKIIYLTEGSFVSTLKEFNKIVKEKEPDIVHSVLFDANVLGRASRISTRNFIHLESLVNETYSSYRLRDPNLNRFKLETYRFFDFVTQTFGVDHYHSNGNSVAKHYQKKLHLKPSRITIIPRGRKENLMVANVENNKSIRDELQLNNKIILINVARHEFQKAQHVILDALYELKDIKDDFVLLLVGRAGELTSQIKLKIEEYHLEDRVKILGHRNDVSGLLAASDIFVFPSRFEGLPGALIEAQAAGLPIVCSDISNNREVVKENINALIFPVDNPIVLSEKLKLLISNPEKRLSMGEESIKIFRKNFNIDNVHEKMYNLLLDLKKSKTNSPAI